MNSLVNLTASDAAAKIANGTLTSEELMIASLNRIEAREQDVNAWAYLNAEVAIKKARECDRLRNEVQSKKLGPLYGVPIGIKDVIDTAKLPTNYGSPIYQKNFPAINARCIDLLENAGAIIIGKTVTAEFATYKPGLTTNPHNKLHTPGGSSSGSAAAVADFHIPLAVGTQTAGSIIRPASYCGVIGFKPSKGRYDTTGVLDTSRSLDTIGTFTRSISDTVLLDKVLSNQSKRISSESIAPPFYGELTVGLCKSPVWAHASSDMQTAVLQTSQRLKLMNINVVSLELPNSFVGLLEAHKKIHMREAALLFEHIQTTHNDKMSNELLMFIAEGHSLEESEYQDALNLQIECKGQLELLFSEVDMLLTPAATGAAPIGLNKTGDPLFSRIWTTLGVPCLSFPAELNSCKLPLGMQLVGMLNTDNVFLRNCQHLLNKLGDTHDLNQ
jgi:amidase